MKRKDPKDEQTSLAEIAWALLVILFCLSLYYIALKGA